MADELARQCDTTSEQADQICNMVNKAPLIFPCTRGALVPRASQARREADAADAALLQTPPRPSAPNPAHVYKPRSCRWPRGHGRAIHLRLAEPPPPDPPTCLFTTHLDPSGLLLALEKALNLQCRHRMTRKSRDAAKLVLAPPDQSSHRRRWTSTTPPSRPPSHPP